MPLPFAAVKNLRIFLLAFLLTFTAITHAQFQLAWEKHIGYDDNTAMFHDVTCVKEISGRELIAYTVTINGKEYPGISCLAPDDFLTTMNNFSLNEGLENYKIVDITQQQGDTIIAYCNDYTNYNDGKAVPRPAEMRFVLMPENQLKFLNYFDEKIADVEGVTAIYYRSAYYSKQDHRYFAIHYHSAAKDYINLYEIAGKKIITSATFHNAVNMQIWWASEENVLISTESPFSSNEKNRYYEVMMLDKNFKIIRKYPETLQYLKPGATDRLVSIDYRPDYHLGFVNRQVNSLEQKNYLNNFLFNGFAVGTYNKLVGEDKDVVIGESVSRPGNNIVEAEYGNIAGSGNHNWVVSVDTTAAGNHDQLVFSIETYTGLLMAQLKVGDTADEESDSASSHDGLGAIDPAFSSIKSFARKSNDEVYVAAHLAPGLSHEGGIYISKWTIDKTDERLDPDYLTKKYGRKVFTGNSPISNETIKQPLLLVAIDESDPEFSIKDKLIGKQISLPGTLEPVANTWFWKGTVMIGKKKYTFSKIVIAKTTG